MEKSTELDVFAAEVVEHIKEKFNLVCNIGNGKTNSTRWITCISGERKLLLHNFTPLVINYKHGVLKHIDTFLAQWLTGANIDPININDDICTTIITHLITKSKWNDKLPKSTTKNIIRKLKIIMNMYPKNMQYALQGLSYYLNGEFATKYIKPKVYKHGIIVQETVRGSGSVKETVIPVRYIAKDQGIVNALSTPSEINKECDSYETFMHVVNTLELEPLSLVYALMLLIQFGPPGFVVDEHDTRTVASPTDITDLASALGAKVL